MNRRIWLLLSTSLLAIAAIIGMANAAGATDDRRPASEFTYHVSRFTTSHSVLTCADIPTYRLDRQLNMHARLILRECGYVGGNNRGSPSAGKPVSGPSFAGNLAGPLLGGTDADVILPDGTYPNVAQSESFVYGHGNTIVVNYNDTRSTAGYYVGLSYSTDGGATWHAGQPLCTGHGTNYGDPVVVYDAAHSHWVAGDLTTGCGGQGVGLWTSSDGINWSPGPCAFNSGEGDRPSMYVDNNPSSPNYGTMFISYNDFAITGPPISVVRSTDGGATWSAPVNLPLPISLSFIRNVQDTGGVNGTFFVEAMDEGGGGLNPRHNYIYRSTDGGQTWSSPISQGPPFPAPGVATHGYFASEFPTAWQYMGWGQPAAGPGGVVHYAFSEHGSGPDPSDVYYTRSTDDGVTWSAPIKLNTDSSPGNGNWEPSVAATASGAVLVTWYDGRNGVSASCDPPGSTTPCYERWGRVSFDNGATWQSDDVISDAPSGLPGDPNSANTNEGDYDYSTANGDVGYTAWNDGRVPINGLSQSDVFFDKVSLVQGTPTPTVLATSTATATHTQPTATDTPAASPTHGHAISPTATNAAQTTNTPQPTATACTLEFSDVPPGSTFYPYIHCLACRGIINGYPDGTFRPNNGVTRGQLSKIVSNSAGFHDPQSVQMFQDVPVTSTFFVYIGRLASRGYINGYPCGGPPGGPCVPPHYLPYFLPNRNATRGQISKIVSNAAGFNDPPSGQQFQDVGMDSTFYAYIYRLATRHVMQGYPCGGKYEPCIPPANLPYFRPNNNATRGQTSKIVSNTFFPECNPNPPPFPRP